MTSAVGAAEAVEEEEAAEAAAIRKVAKPVTMAVVTEAVAEEVRGP